MEPFRDCRLPALLRLVEEGASTVVVSQTWSEVHRVNERVRAGATQLSR